MEDYLKFKVVWSGLEGGAAGEPYHIVYEGCSTVRSCWCPEGAATYLKSLGITVEESSLYSSGFQALGCHFLPGFKEMDTIPNKYLKNELIKV